MVGSKTYGEVAERIASGSISAAEAFDWTLANYDANCLSRMIRLMQQSGVLEARVLFYRCLYRFYLRSEEIRSEYIKLLQVAGGLQDRLLVIRAADLIDIGQYDEAFELLTAGLEQLNDRWLKSALFQIVRIGVRSDAHAGFCLSYASHVRNLFEDEFRADVYQDRITKYVLCNLFVTHQFIKKMATRSDSCFIKQICEQMANDIMAILSVERNWDAC